MKRGLQIVLIILSLIPLYFGVTGVLFGAGQWIAAEAVTPAIDNQYRYLSAFYLVLAFLLWWMIPNIEKHTTPVRLIVLAIFLGGLARLYSAMNIGTPPMPNIIGTALELGSPILALWQAKVASENN